ncbi:ornithine cyclodeaminase family protein [Actinomadura monticuli]|uniref:Ornithine cyclodeaminase family protein n=1 Tax=Actinomadura monticuli TaxID=3097367 RepID=A0ABV4Q4L7_9ACTN
MTTIKIIAGREVAALVTIADLIEPMRAALIAYSTGGVHRHPRVTAALDGDDQMLIMPAAVDQAAGLKILTMFPGAVAHGLPSVQGLVVLIDGVTGEPRAVLDGTTVTELRTGAVSALATDRLARPDARTLALIGSGVQGRAHLRALAEIRPWTEVRVYGRTRESADRLAESARGLALPARSTATVAEAVAGADVICTTTSACAPVLDDADVSPGAHVTAVGAFGATCRELPSALVARAALFADSRSAVLSEAGDFLLPQKEGVLPAPQITELGTVLAGESPGRTSPSEITVLKSLGLPIEDVVACDLVYRRALDADAGQDVDLA